MDIPQDGFLRLPQIIGDRKRGIPAIIPVCKSAWYEGCRTGRYPKPVHLGPKTVAWSRSAIAELVEKLKG
ncbi:MAG: AlpA family transcriptional regulator [Betaproteobacteria bacterium HGW-Betaproteobacteria-12]|nr:MAG: AlpA family transcriptional regulator [Betaproteobacteria bacterium HGW-Betaproteobacteria-12]